MALEGSIQEFGLTEIFQLILLQKKEGALTLTEGERSVAVQFKEGAIIQVEAKEQLTEEALGNALVNAGKITGDQLKEGFRQRSTQKKNLAQALIDLGYLTSDQLKKPIRLLTEETVFQLFQWKTGHYKFEQKEITYNTDLIEPLKTEFILMEGMRRLDEWPRLLKKIPSREMVFEIAQAEEAAQSTASEGGETSREDSFESMKSPTSEEPEEEKQVDRILSWIDGKRTVQEVIDLAEIGAFPVYQGLLDLLSEGKVAVKKGSDAAVKKGSDFISLKKVTQGQLALKGVVSGIVAISAVVVLIVSFHHIRVQFSSVRIAGRDFKKLHVWNEQDILSFSLELYYLKHHQYPNALEELVAEGLLKTGIERAIDLKKWIYQPAGSGFRLTPNIM